MMSMRQFEHRSFLDFAQKRVASLSINQLLSDLSDKFKSREIDKRELEHRLLQLIAVEIDEDQLDRATWLKAFSEAEGHSDKSKAFYVKLRLQRMLDQIASLQMQSRQTRMDRETNRAQGQKYDESSRSAPMRGQAINGRPDGRPNSLGMSFLLLFCLIASFGVFYFIFHVM